MRLIKTTFLLILISLHFGCQQQLELKDIQNLNGYWEIKSVTKQDGKEVQYKFNETVDFIKIEAEKGIRKKVKPTFEEEFIVTNDAEKFTLKKENDHWVFYYQTEMDNWEETLLALDENNFKVKNSRGITYTYQRFKGYLDGTE